MMAKGGRGAQGIPAPGVRRVMRFLLLLGALVVVVFLGNLLWVSVFGGRSLF